MVIIGSKAIKHYFPDFPREPKDIDIICNDTTEECINNRWDELMLIKGEKRIERLSNPILLERYSHNKSNLLVCLSTNDIYTLKISHMFWDIKWNKHMFDIVFLTKKGCNFDENLFWDLYKYWEEKHGKRKTSDLTKSTDTFFNNALKKYDHDYLHTIINLNPLYKRILVEDDKVTTSQSKWENLTRQEKLDLIREECYVMAFERLADRDYRTAYSWQLKQLILHHLPLWQAIFAIENYDKLRKPIINYKEKIENELSRNSK